MNYHEMKTMNACEEEDGIINRKKCSLHCDGEKLTLEPMLTMLRAFGFFVPNLSIQCSCGNLPPKRYQFYWAVMKNVVALIFTLLAFAFNGFWSLANGVRICTGWQWHPGNMLDMLMKMRPMLICVYLAIFLLQIPKHRALLIHQLEQAAIMLNAGEAFKRRIMILLCSFITILTTFFVSLLVQHFFYDSIFIKLEPWIKAFQPVWIALPILYIFQLDYILNFQLKNFERMLLQIQSPAITEQRERTNACTLRQIYDQLICLCKIQQSFCAPIRCFTMGWSMFACLMTFYVIIEKSRLFVQEPPLDARGLRHVTLFFWSGLIDVSLFAFINIVCILFAQKSINKKKANLKMMKLCEKFLKIRTED